MKDMSPSLCVCKMEEWSLLPTALSLQISGERDDHHQNHFQISGVRDITQYHSIPRQILSWLMRTRPWLRSGADGIYIATRWYGAHPLCFVLWICSDDHQASLSVLTLCLSITPEGDPCIHIWICDWHVPFVFVQCKVCRINCLLSGNPFIIAFGEK